MQHSANKNSDTKRLSVEGLRLYGIVMSPCCDVKVYLKKQVHFWQQKINVLSATAVK